MARPDARIKAVTNDVRQRALSHYFQGHTWAIREKSGHDQLDHLLYSWPGHRETIGYLVVWISIGLAATILQRAFASQGILSEMMAICSNKVAALFVIAIGLYQFAPLKQACLQRCRASVAGGAGDRVQSAGATMPQGMRWGIYCAGSSAALMGLLFVVGPMNLVRMAIIAAWVVAEKNVPWGKHLARVAGIGLVIWGCLTWALTM